MLAAVVATVVVTELVLFPVFESFCGFSILPSLTTEAPTVEVTVACTDTEPEPPAGTVPRFHVTIFPSTLHGTPEGVPVLAVQLT
jgi:hypothetical protein